MAEAHKEKWLLRRKEAPRHIRQWPIHSTPPTPITLLAIITWTTPTQATTVAAILTTRLQMASSARWIWGEIVSKKTTTTRLTKWMSSKRRRRVIEEAVLLLLPEPLSFAIAIMGTRRQQAQDWPILIWERRSARAPPFPISSIDLRPLRPRLTRSFDVDVARAKFRARAGRCFVRSLVRFSDSSSFDTERRESAQHQQECCQQKQHFQSPPSS